MLRLVSTSLCALFARSRPKKFTQPCDLAFVGWEGHFRKEYASASEREEAKAQFCVNYARLQELDRIASVDITEFMDIDLSELSEDEDLLRLNSSERQNSTLCYSACMAKSPLGIIPKA